MRSESQPALSVAHRNRLLPFSDAGWTGSGLYLKQFRSVNKNMIHTKTQLKARNDDDLAANKSQHKHPRDE